MMITKYFILILRTLVQFIHVLNMINGIFVAQIWYYIYICITTPNIQYSLLKSSYSTSYHIMSYIDIHT